MTTAQVVETSATLNNSPIQGYLWNDSWVLSVPIWTKKFFPVECLLSSLIAFDTVDHKVLLVKLNYYGFRGIVNQWFFSYLINRKQTTEIDLFTDTAAILN